MNQPQPTAPLETPWRMPAHLERYRRFLRLLEDPMDAERYYNQGPTRDVDALMKAVAVQVQIGLLELLFRERLLMAKIEVKPRAAAKIKAKKRKRRR